MDNNRITLTLSANEFDYLKGMVCAWIDEGFTTPPYDSEVYSLIAKLGITQTDVVSWYDITPPPAGTTEPV